MAIRRGVPIILTLPMYNSTGSRKSGLTFTAGTCQISKDGGTFANTTNLPTEIGTSGVYKLQLTSVEVDCAWLHIITNISGANPQDRVIETTNSQMGTVVSNAGNTAQTFQTNLTQTSDDWWRDCLLVWTSGVNTGALKLITNFNHTTQFITVDEAFPAGIPAAGDKFAIINI